MVRLGRAALVLLLVGCHQELGRQAPPSDLERERAAYADWLLADGASPYRAIARLQLDDVVTIGPEDSHLPLAGVETHTVEPGPGAATMVAAGTGATVTLAPYRQVQLGPYYLSFQGGGSRPVLMVYDSEMNPPDPPGWFPADSSWRFEVPLERADGGSVPMLTLDGLEVRATVVGHVVIDGVRLQVRNVPQPGTDESDLEIYFRDGTSGAGSYPAGRFVPVYRSAEGSYLVDFNLARNPFCAYSTVYPCPIPWRGNTIERRVEAGERYAGGGLEVDLGAE